MGKISILKILNLNRSYRNDRLFKSFIANYVFIHVSVECYCLLHHYTGSRSLSYYECFIRTASRTRVAIMKKGIYHFLKMIFMFLSVIIMFISYVFILLILSQLVAYYISLIFNLGVCI